MTHILARVALAGAILCALAQAAPAQVLLKNASFEDSQFFIAPWELVVAESLVNPRVVKDPRYGNFFATSQRTSGWPGIRQAFSITGAKSAICTFGAYWRANAAVSKSAILRFEIRAKSDDSLVSSADSYVTQDRTGIWQPFAYWVALKPGDYWALIRMEHVLPLPQPFEIDEVVLRIVTAPMVIPKGRDSVDCHFYVASSDERVWHVLCLALQRLDNPIPIPGIRGVLELDPFRDGGLLILGVKLGSTFWTIPYSPIASLDRTIFLQALDFNPILSVMQFGSRTGVLYYK